MNEKFAHTPGPWSFDTSDRTILGEDKSLAITTVDCFDRGGNKGFFFGQESEANARLIAAAPELLADLQEAASTLRRYEVLHRAKGTEDSTEKAEVNAALAARFESIIAKALGKTSEAA